MMNKETWMSGRDAVDKGFADEILFENEPQIAMSKDQSLLMVNGIHFDMTSYNSRPDVVNIIDNPKPVSDKANNLLEDNGEIEMEEIKMEIKNLDELKSAYPEFAQQIELRAREDAVSAERERIKTIESIENAVGDKEMINAAKYGDKPITAEQLAFAALQKQASLGADFLANQKKDAKQSNASQVDGQPNGGQPGEDSKQEIEKLAKAIAGKDGEK